MGGVFVASHQQAPPPVTPTTTRPSPQPTQAPTPRRTRTPAPTNPTTTEPVPSAQPGSYPRERDELTPLESAAYGDLRQGDCVTNPPDDLSGGVMTVICERPHTDQVMGFVDLSEGMPDHADGIRFEAVLSARCNSLMATLPIPAGFDRGVKISYPDDEQWAAGVRAALCWVPVFGKTWVGSAIDGTARVV